MVVDSNVGSSAWKEDEGEDEDEEGENAMRCGLTRLPRKDEADESRVLDQQPSRTVLQDLAPVISIDDVRSLQAAVDELANASTAVHTLVTAQLAATATITAYQACSENCIAQFGSSTPNCSQALSVLAANSVSGASAVAVSCTDARFSLLLRRHAGGRLRIEPRLAEAATPCD